MPWTPAHTDLLVQYERVYPLPPAPNNDEACREWTRRASEQFAYSFPGEGWGHKQASPTRPPSTDVIATRSPFQGFDLIANQGIASQALNLRPGPLDLTGQVYIPVVPTDHLETSPPPPDPPPTTTLEARVAELEAWRQSVGRVTTTQG